MLNSVLIVEDDPALKKYLKELMLDNGFSANIASDGLEAINYLKNSQPDIVLLDLGLPKISGETVCQDIIKNYPNLPVIILTARDSVTDVVEGLNLGADDYITKPFNAEELIARIKTRLRKSGNPDILLQIADLKLDTRTMEVYRNDKLISLTPKEFQLLRYLMSNQGRVLTREMILNRIWLYSLDVESRVVDVYMGYLRKKIDNGNDHKLIHSIRGFGYLIKN